MGYYATYNGYMKFKEKPDELILNHLEEVFYCDGFDPENLDAAYSGDEKYYEDEVFSVLQEVKPFVENGEFVFHGEDDCHWRFIFRDGNWIEEGGQVYYESDLPLLNNNSERIEFIGEIIDIMQDHQDELNGDIIIGESYDKISSKLINLMKNWKVF